MRRKIKIALLSLGVVLGYGLGIGHIVRHRGEHWERRACMHDCMEGCRGEGDGRHARGHGDERPPSRGGGPDTSMR
jgi:hypothetical protein